MTETFFDHRCTPNAGELTSFDMKKMPFEPKRVFVVSGVPVGADRGHHAHKKNKQLLFCLNGGIKLTIDNGDEKSFKVLTKGQSYFHSNLEWISYEFLLVGTMMVSFCSRAYEENDYIREYKEFQTFISKKEGK